MDETKIVTLLDKIAFESVNLDAADTASANKLSALLHDLRELLGNAARVDETDIIAQCLEHLARCSSSSGEPVEKHIAALNEELAALQRKIMRRLSEPSKAQPEAEASTPGETDSPNAFELPPWVEEKVFTDFLSQQPGILDEIEGDILALEKDGEKERAGAALKRRLHSMKGESGMLGLDGLEKVCHSVEDFLMRPGPSAVRIDRLLQFKDWAQKALESYGEHRMPSVSAETMIALLESPLTPSAAARQAQSAPKSPKEQAEPKAPKPPSNNSGKAEAQEFSWDDETVAMFGEFYQESEEGLTNADQILLSVEQNGADLENVNALFRVFHTIKGVAGFLELKEVSSLAHTTETMLNQVRQGKLELDGSVLDLTFDSVGLMRRMTKELYASVEKRAGFSETPELPTLLDRLNAVIQGRVLPAPVIMDVPPGLKLGEILTRAPTHLPTDVLSEALEAQKDTGRLLGEELVAMGALEAKQVGAAIRSQKVADAKEAAAKIKETVKVDIDRVDSLVEMIGELVIVESMVVNAEEIAAITQPRVRNYLSQLGKLTRDLQDVGMRMRMVPVRGVFQKMARMVRDLSRKKGVQIRFELDGEGTEMDRSMVEQISDPLVHMIRNAVDHGMESREVRIASEKEVTGLIKLSAYHEGGSIVIELADDGAGLNREAILRKAKEQGLVSDKDVLSDNEVYNLIFAPGFSTAKQVTEISGRGVGMDVVKRNVEAMRGRVSISTVPGRGTTFKMVLPLTLAIIEGMLVAVGGERYIIPTLSVIESMVLQRNMYFSFAGAHELINVRGEILPLVRLSSIFEVADAKTDLSDGLVVIVEGVGTRFGIFIDDVVTQQQVVIKSLGDRLKDVKGQSGAAILGDGSVGLILDVNGIVEYAQQEA